MRPAGPRRIMPDSAAAIPSYDLVTLGETLLRLSPPGMQRLDQARGFEVGIGGSELELSKPDLKRRLADEDPQLAADPLPIREIAVARGSELMADRGELDDDGALSFAAAVGDVVLDDRDPATAAPPFGGLGGKGSRVLGFEAGRV